jgi:hypothetical protein
MISVTNPVGPTRRAGQRCSSTPMTRTPASRSGPTAAIRSGDSAHRDRTDGMPGHTQLRGDRRDRSAVDHQPPQHIPGIPPRRGRPRSSQLAQVLIEHRTPALRGHKTVSGHRYLQHQRIAGHREIGQRAGDGVAAAVRAAWITRHRRTEDRRSRLVDSGIGDRDPQLNRAHDRVGNNRRWAGLHSRLRKPSCCKMQHLSRACTASRG